MRHHLPLLFATWLAVAVRHLRVGRRTRPAHGINRLTHAFAALTAAFALAACGGPVAEALARLIEASVEPASATAAQGTSLAVTLKVNCDREGLDTPFGRLGVQVRAEPGSLPAGTGVTFNGGISPPSSGYYTVSCNTATANPNLRTTSLPVELNVGAATPPGLYHVVFRVRVEPETLTDPPKDETTAELALTVRAPDGESVVSGNLLADPGFEGTVAAGGLPAAAAAWQGDAAATPTAELDVVPRSGARMLKFVATGTVSSTNTLAAQMWQVADLREWTAAVATGTARVDGSAWFNRVDAGAATDRRFDLRLLAFDVDPADVPARYAAGTWTAEAVASLDSRAFAWQRVDASLALPAGTRCVLFEIYAFEDQVNDGAGAEFAGHYADDTSLVLVKP